MPGSLATVQCSRATRTAIRRAAALGALIVLAAACGNGKATTTDTSALAEFTTSTAVNGDSSSTTGPGGPGGSATTAKGATATTAKGGTATTGAKAPTTTAKPTALPSDVARAKGYLLNANDVGAGYEKNDSNDGASEDDGGFEKCGKGNPVFAKDNPNEFRGDTFTKGKGSFSDSVTVGSDATVAASVAQASEAMNIIKNDEFLRCVEEQTREQFAKQAPPGTTSDVKASRRPLTGAEDAVDIHVTVTATSATFKITVDIDAFTYRKANTVAVALVTLIGPANSAEPARVADIMKRKIG